MSRLSSLLSDNVLPVRQSCKSALSITVLLLLNDASAVLRMKAIEGTEGTDYLAELHHHRHHQQQLQNAPASGPPLCIHSASFPWPIACMQVRRE